MDDTSKCSVGNKHHATRSERGEDGSYIERCMKCGVVVFSRPHDPVKDTGR